MTNKILIVIGLVLLFVGLFNVSIFVFNFFNAWLGIAIGIITVFAIIITLSRIINKWKF
jgi:membrane protein YdbS with pleckstrin-like domain